MHNLSVMTSLPASRPGPCTRLTRLRGARGRLSCSRLAIGQGTLFGHTVDDPVDEVFFLAVDYDGLGAHCGNRSSSFGMYGLSSDVWNTGKDPMLPGRSSVTVECRSSVAGNGPSNRGKSLADLEVVRSPLS